LRKRFAVAKHICKIDLTIELLASSDATQNQVRLFWPAPIMPDIKYDTISALVNNVKDSIEKIPYSKLNGQEGWWAPTIFGAENKYFVHAMVTDQSHFAERAYFLMRPDNRLISIIEGPSVVPHETYSWTMSFYCGPKEAHAMNQVNARLEETLDYSGVLAPLSKLLLKLLNFLYGYVHNYGLAILLLTLIIKLIMLPFTIGGERGLKKSNEVQKKMRYLEQKYKNDPERLRIEQAEVIKKHGLPQLASCLPMLAQFPIFIALSRVLNNSVDLYQAPFFGWITDLSAPDPYYILPAILIGGMILQGLSGDPAQRMMTLTAALILGAVSPNFAAGLVLYICASTLLSVLQIMIQKSVKAA
jgi:YidC/Oxa1 family membrane protein insertase